MSILKAFAKRNLITFILIIINILVFLVVDFTGGGTSDSGHMIAAGAAYPPLILEKGQWYRLITCIFLHFGIEHLINNMLVLGVLGERLEPMTGRIRFLIIYLTGGIGGNLVSLYISSRTKEYAVSAGASGAVFALMGSLLYVILCNRGRVKDLSVQRIIIMAALSIYLGFASGGVDNAAHIGGMISGFLVSILLYRR